MEDRTMPSDALTKVRAVDDDALAVFDDPQVKHEVLHKIWELHRDDERHALHEINKLEHIKYYKPILYATEPVPFGTNYFGKILLNENEQCIHVRVLKAEGGTLNFHAVHWRSPEKGGAIFGKDDELEYFEY
ncbi:hypothetical protein DACRYDRAFT_20689 [Dacryopinax primogenitus]|uniref:Uncharacterized protein n=1 Tax=Dacryopinax primogenitus (strain DJM 731) TaxID=1858805 RepID=M5GCP4_DACPD|nr:uncharacterized protein DACRYDRAFT_20689 [Dacryopinax primogenitus]EJU03987.1 hypothetical protein DACRYDRAFT_20689 [Dacryopinax primogenitus]